MGYERDDRHYASGGNNRGSGDDRERAARSFGEGRDAHSDDYGAHHRDRGGRPADYGAQRGGSYDRDPRDQEHQDRGFLERAGDEVRSWFGDEDAERRRRYDERDSGDDRERGSFARGGQTGNHGYGADVGYGLGGVRGLSGSDQGRQSSPGHDPSYRSWRDSQMEAFDRDYEEYRREHQSKFDSEFGAWRQTRQNQRVLLGQVREHQEVVGSDGQHIGTVDHVRSDHIKLTRTDQGAADRHHSIPCSWIHSVNDKITVSKTADEAKQHWREERSGEGDGFARTTGRDRSFSGS